MIAPVAKRLLLLWAVLFLGFSVIYVLPKTPAPPPPGVIMALPDFIGDWYGQEATVTEKERQVLGSETRFARKLYTNARGEAIYVSIVLAGEDMSTSIHRPERCLPAQGYTIVDKHTVKAALAAGSLTMTRLHNIRPFFDGTGKPYLFPDGKQANEFSLLYYWFVGSTETTDDHTARYFIDARDRLFKGCNQSWAYVTVMSRITEKLDTRFGRNEAQTDAMIHDFILKLAPLIQSSAVKTR
ncbi:MAG: exosortase-associated EpsI family protein [Verrucomicrobiota bacterium]